MNATLFGVSGIYKGTLGSLSKGRLIIGREQPAGLLFSNDATVSRQHAVIFFENGAWFCADLGSTNGTFVNNERIGNSAVMLASGATLRFGNQILRIDYSPALVAKSVAASSNEPTAPKPSETEYKIPPAAVSKYSTSASSPQPSKQTSQKLVARWFGPKDVLEFGQYIIQYPLIYFGHYFASQPRPKNTVLANGFEIVVRDSLSQDEPSLINPDLTVKPAGQCSALNYYPSYREMSPGQRDIYLRWLADGRRSEVEQGYLFVFFYGIERRLIGPGSEIVDRQERLLLLSEVDALLKHYPSYTSFRHYAAKLVIANWKFAPEYITPDYLDQMRITERGDDDFEWALACLAHNRRNLHAREALVYLKASRRVVGSKTVIMRCWPDIENLFTTRLYVKHVDGIQLKASSNEVAFQYAPANSTMRSAIPPNSICAARAAGSRDKLRSLKDLALRCIADLDEYSRKLGPNPTKADHIRAQTVLPVEIRPETPVDGALRSGLQSACNGAISSIALGKLLSLAGIGDLPASKSVIVDLSCILESAGFIMEPDPRFGALTPAPDDLICVAPIKELSNQTPSPNYLEAISLVALGASVARAGGGHTSEKKSVIVAETTSALNLSEIERERLNLYLTWAETAEPRVRKLTVESIAPQSREAAADLLVAIAIADGGVVPAEVTELLRIFKMLGMPAAKLYTMLHDTQSGSSAPVRAAIARQPAENCPASIGSAAAFIDMDVVQSKLKNTEHISTILTEIFAEETVDQPAAFTPNQAPVFSREIPLLERLTPGEISATAFGVVASAAGLLPNAAFEMLNSLALEKCNELLLDGDDPIFIDADVLKELQT